MALSFATVGGKVTAAIINTLVTWVNTNTPGMVSMPVTAFGGAASTSGGSVSFSSAASAGLNFATTVFDNYRIVLDITQSVAGTITMQLADNTNTAIATAIYGAAVQYANSATPASAVQPTTTNWSITPVTSTRHRIIIDLWRPMLADQKGIQATDAAGAGTTGYGVSTFGGGMSSTALLPGILLTFITGTGTGTARVYGYNNNN